MEVYEFDKTFLSRYNEMKNILTDRGANIPASEIRAEWINFIEVAVEPIGWQALFKPSRAVCQELSVKYPLFVIGTVEQVLFDELKVVFFVEATQDTDIHLPERLVVLLEELWPLREQNNPALNISVTADCIDKLRYFYQHIWMPWDIDNDERDWAQQHLECRIRLSYDLKNKTMSRRLSSHILALLAEANYIQRKRELIEFEMEQEDEEEVEEGNDVKKRARTGALMKLHLRMNAIKNEIEILENPTMRSAFEITRFGGMENETTDESTYIVSHIGTLDQQIEYLQLVKRNIDVSHKVQIYDSLQAVLQTCKASDSIYLPPGVHNIKFLEYMNSNGSIRGINPISFTECYDNGKLDMITSNTVVASKDDDSVLLTIDGDFTIENVQLDCRNVRTGVLIKKGKVTFRNCYLIGDPKSCTQQGIVIFGNSNITLDQCVIKHFSAGIYSNHDCYINLTSTVVSDCITGLEVLDDCKIHFETSKIRNCSQYGALLEDFNGSESSFREGEKVTFEDYNTVTREEFTFEGNCEFHGNKNGNFVVRKGCSGKFNSSCFVDLPADETLLDDSLLGTNVSFANFLDASKLSSTKRSCSPIFERSANDTLANELSSSLTEGDTVHGATTIPVAELTSQQAKYTIAADCESEQSESSVDSETVIVLEDTVIEID